MMTKTPLYSLLFLTLSSFSIANTLSEEEIQKALAGINQIKVLKNSEPEIVSEVVLKKEKVEKITPTKQSVKKEANSKNKLTLKDETREKKGISKIEVVERKVTTETLKKKTYKKKEEKEKVEKKKVDKKKIYKKKVYKKRILKQKEVEEDLSNLPIVQTFGIVAKSEPFELNQ